MTLPHLNTANGDQYHIQYANTLLLHICHTYAAGHVAVFASPMYVTVTRLSHSRETPDYILVTPLLHKCYAFCGILCGFHNVAFCPGFVCYI